MKNQREQRSSTQKYNDFNSVILACRPATVDKYTLTQDDYNMKLKQIKALKKFQQIFRKDILQKQLNIHINRNRGSGDTQYQLNKKKQSPHQCNNRLKGMFFLRRKAQLQNKYQYPHQSSEEQTSEEQSINHTIQGKTFSPSKQKYKITKLKKYSQSKPYNFVNIAQNTSSKLMTGNFIQRRPHSQLDSNTQTQKIFNSRTLYTAILAANKVKLLGIRPSNFAYFSVYVEQGNNSQLIKSAVRKRSGWKVVEMPTVANMIWSQYYRKNLDIKIKYKNKNHQVNLMKNNDDGLELRDNLTNLPGLIESSLLKKKLLQKQLQNNPNLLSLQQYNKQIHKICPKSQHLHRKPALQISPNINLYFYNHIPNHHLISDKTNLLRNMKKLYESRGQNIFKIMPFSIDITDVCEYEELVNKMNIEGVTQGDGYWIVKPGENSNRGRGIMVCKGLQSAITEINLRFTKKDQFQQQQKSQELPRSNSNQRQKQTQSPKQKKSQKSSIILQKYIQPLLYNKRKFDIRMYLLVTVVNQKIRGYVYEQGYIRTSSKIFTMNTFNKFVHLTNDAIQSRSSDYGKYEQGNKISWKKYQKWLEDQGYGKFWGEFTNDYKSICKDILESVKEQFKKGNSKHYKQHYSEHILSMQNKPQNKSSCSSYEVQNMNQFNQCSLNPLSSALTPLASLKQKQKFYFQVFGLDFLIDNTPKTWLIQVNTNPAITTDCSRVVNSIIPQMIDNAFTIAVQPYLRNSSHRQFDTVKFQNSFQVIFDDQWT